VVAVEIQVLRQQQEAQTLVAVAVVRLALAVLEVRGL
jgi:hypothetical protein